jgi:hypothetical protein
MIRRAIVWLYEHPWAIVSAMGAFLAVLLFRRKPATLQPIDLKIAAAKAKSEVETDRVKELEPEVQAVKDSLIMDAKQVEVISNDKVVGSLSDFLSGHGL